MSFETKKDLATQEKAKEAVSDALPDKHFDALANILGLDAPLAQIRLSCLRQMCKSAYETGEKVVMHWPRRGGLSRGDYCKTTTIQIFLLHHMKSGSKKTVAVLCPTKRQTAFFIRDVIRAVLHPDSGVKYIRFDATSIAYVAGEGQSVIVFGSNPCHIRADILICDDANFCVVPKPQEGQVVMTFDTPTIPE